MPLSDSLILVGLAIIVSTVVTIGVLIIREKPPLITRLTTLGVVISIPIVAIIVGLVLIG